MGKKKIISRNNILTAVTVFVLVIFLGILQADSISFSYIITIIERSCIYSVAAVSMNLMIGFSGQFSLGTAGFMCLGAYITGVLTMPVHMRDQVFYLYGMAGWLHDIELPLILALIVAGVIGAFLAFLVGWPVLRLKSDYLAIATLGFSEIVRAFCGWEGLGKITNASYGLSNIPAFSSIFECVGICAVCIIIMLLMINSSYGRAYKAIRDNDIAAEAMGINLFYTKQLAFVVSSFFATVSGGLLAVFLRSVAASTFTVALTYNILLMVVIGGIGSVSGSIVGAFLITCGQEWLRFLDKTYYIGSFEVPLLRTGFRMVIFSILLMCVVLFWNRGIMGGREFCWDNIIAFFKNLPGLPARMKEKHAARVSAKKAQKALKGGKES